MARRAQAGEHLRRQERIQGRDIRERKPARGRTVARDGNRPAARPLLGRDRSFPRRTALPAIVVRAHRHALDAARNATPLQRSRLLRGAGSRVQAKRGGSRLRRVRLARDARIRAQDLDATRRGDRHADQLSFQRSAGQRLRRRERLLLQLERRLLQGRFVTRARGKRRPQVGTARGR